MRWIHIISKVVYEYVNITNPTGYEVGSLTSISELLSISFIEAYSTRYNQAVTLLDTDHAGLYLTSVILWEPMFQYDMVTRLFLCRFIQPHACYFVKLTFANI